MLQIENQSATLRHPPRGEAGQDGARVPPPPILLRLDGVRATPASVARVRQRVAEINRQFELAGVPFRLRVA